MKEIDVADKKKILLDIMDSIDAFCSENKLTYLLSYGSLLGAVRHKGFIPWDDDIDIIMPRPDYEKFITAYENSRFAVASYRDKTYFPMCFAKVYDKNTVCFLNDTINLGYGVAVDIFPVDGIPSSDDESTSFYCAFQKRDKRYMRCLFYESKPAITSIKNIIGYVYRWLFNTRRQAAAVDCFVSSVSYDTAEYAGNILATVRLEKLPKTLYQHICDYQFEDRTYKGPADYDTMLTAQYGNDYMTPPPADNRESLHSERYYYCE